MEKKTERVFTTMTPTGKLLLKQKAASMGLTLADFLEAIAREQVKACESPSWRNRLRSRLQEIEAELEEIRKEI